MQAFAAAYQTAYPSAVRCLLSDRAQLTSYLRLPVEHHKRIRHSNFIERTFGETRRRVKVIGRLPGEASCLSLVWAVLDRASRGWRGLAMTPAGSRLLHDLRRTLIHPHLSADTPSRSTARRRRGITSTTTEPRYAVIYTAPGTRPARYARMVYGKAVPSKSSIMEPGTGPELLAHGVGWRF